MSEAVNDAALSALAGLDGESPDLAVVFVSPQHRQLFDAVPWLLKPLLATVRTAAATCSSESGKVSGRGLLSVPFAQSMAGAALHGPEASRWPTSRKRSGVKSWLAPEGGVSMIRRSSACTS